MVINKFHYAHICTTPEMLRVSSRPPISTEHKRWNSQVAYRSTSLRYDPTENRSHPKSSKAHTQCIAPLNRKN